MRFLLHWNLPNLSWNCFKLAREDHKFLLIAQIQYVRKWKNNDQMNEYLLHWKLSYCNAIFIFLIDNQKRHQFHIVKCWWLKHWLWIKLRCINSLVFLCRLCRWWRVLSWTGEFCFMIKVLGNSHMLVTFRCTDNITKPVL